jgi:hypothetical protein
MVPIDVARREVMHMGEQRRSSPEAGPDGLDAIDWLAPHRLERLAKMCEEVERPWRLISWKDTTTGTIILHDANGVSIADLQTAGPPCACDKLIAIAPSAIAQLVAEVQRLRGICAIREQRFAAGEQICIGCGCTPVDTFGGLCIDCDAAVEENEHG